MSDLVSRFELVRERGRKLCDNYDARAFHDAPFVIAFECEGRAFDLAIRRISLFALVLSAIIAGIVLLGAAPRPILLISLVWAGGAGAVRWVARARRRQHGHFVVDFENDRLGRAPLAGGVEEVPLGRGTQVRVWNSVDEGAPFWLVVIDPRGVVSRLLRGRPEELLPVVRVFRSYNYDVDARALEAVEE
jgi:hypothetical protein